MVEVLGVLTIIGVLSVYLDGNRVYTNLDARNQRRVLFAVCK